MSGHLYVVEVGNLVKVGSTGGDRFSRLGSYVGQLDKGALLSWTSGAHAGYRASEMELISRLRDLDAPAQGQEWFAIDFMTVVEMARDVVSDVPRAGRKPISPALSSPYYSIEQTMAILGLSLSTLKRRLAEGPTRGGFTRVKIGRSVRIPRREVDALLPKTRRRV